MDTYQPIYDAVRSKIIGGDVDSAIETAIRDMNLPHYAEQVGAAYQESAAEQLRPCVIFKPKVYVDGDMWCSLYGENIQDGVAGFGKSPSDAMLDFDKSWHTNLSS